MTRPTYRDGKVHVRQRMCSTCIFRPGNLMDLRAGRVEQMVEEATADPSGSITCHDTLDADHAVCRGFFDRHRGFTLRLAEVTGAIEYVP